MKKRLLITGASGFVGFHLVEAARHQGFEVHAAVRQSSNVDATKPYVDKFVYPDFSDIHALRQLFEAEQYHYIIHAAAMTKAKHESDLQLVNVSYAYHVVQAAFEASMPLERLVFVSSLAAIGPIAYEREDLIAEDAPYHPVTAYGRSKRDAERMIHRDFADKAISVFRPTAVYGPREKDIFILLETLSKGLDPYIGRDPQKLSFVYVKDLVAILLRGLTDSSPGISYYNVSDGHVYSRYAMADICKELFGRRLWRVHVPFGLVSTVAKLAQWAYKSSSKTPVVYPERLEELCAENWGCDITRAREQLGFAPKYDLEAGLRESITWYKDNKWL